MIIEIIDVFYLLVIYTTYLPTLLYYTIYAIYLSLHIK